MEHIVDAIKKASVPALDLEGAKDHLFVEPYLLPIKSASCKIMVFSACAQK